MKRFLAVIVTAAMLFALVPSVFAVGSDPYSPDAPVFQVSELTPERVWCVTQWQVADNAGVLYYAPEYKYIPLPGQPDEVLELSTLINEDGTFTEYTKNVISDIINELGEELVDPEMLEGIEIPDSIYDVFRLVTDLLYTVVYEGLFQDAAETGYTDKFDAFIANYPDSGALYAEIIDTYFDGNEIPSLEELLSFICGDYVRIEDASDTANKQGVKYVEYFSKDPVDEEYFWLYDVVAPNGAYKSDMTGFAGNVYDSLNDRLSDGWMSSNDYVFSLVTGYKCDSYGYLYTICPQNVYVLDEDGNKVTDPTELLDENGNFKSTGKSLRDTAVEGLMESYRELYSEDFYTETSECPEVYMGEFLPFCQDFVMQYIVDEWFEDMERPWETEEELRALAETEIDDYMAMMEEFGETEFILFEMCGYFYDDYGYICEDTYYGYVVDEDGNRLRWEDAVDDDDKLLIGDRKGESIYAILNEYLENVDPTALLKGDATGDGYINLSDVTVMLKSVAGWENAGCDITAADTNGDGTVNLADVTLAMKYIAGWEVSMVY